MSSGKFAYWRPQLQALDMVCLDGRSSRWDVRRWGGPRAHPQSATPGAGDLYVRIPIGDLRVIQHEMERRGRLAQMYRTQLERVRARNTKGKGLEARAIQKK